MAVAVAHQLGRALGRGVQAERRLGTLQFSERHLRIGIVDRAGRGDELVGHR